MARTRLAERHVTLDPPLWQLAPAHRVWRGPPAPAARRATGPGGRSRLHDDRAGSGGLW